MSCYNIYSFCQYSKFLVRNYCHNYCAQLPIQVPKKFSYPNTDTLVRCNHSMPMMTLLCHYIIMKSHEKIDSCQVNTKLPQTAKFTKHSHCTQNESTNELKPMPESSIGMPGAIEIDREVHKRQTV